MPTVTIWDDLENERNRVTKDIVDKYFKMLEEKGLLVSNTK